MALARKAKNGFGVGASVKRIPPHNIEAEQSLLGSMMISEDAISVVAETVRPEDFYKETHANVYEAILRLWSRGEPTDPITISEELKAAAVLDEVGGKPYIHTLMSVVPTAANAKYYAEIVERNAVLRHLIKAATSVASLGYESPEDVEQVIDQAESLIFGVSQKRISEKFTHIKDLLAEGFEQIEKLYEKKAHVTGAPTGFTDMDNVTSGLHPSDLIVIAGRPSMGKCVAYDTEIVDPSTGEVITIEKFFKRKSASLLTLNNHLKLEVTQPSTFVDDGIKPVFKVKTALGREIETTLTHPFLTINGWRPLSELKVGDCIGVPRVIPAHGTYDMPEHEVMTMAYFLADGGLTSSNPRFTNGNEKIMNDFITAVTKFPGIQVNIENRNGLRTPTCCISAKAQDHGERVRLLGQRLKKALRNTSLTQLELAKQASISHGAVHLIANGHCVPTDDTFSRICQVTKKSPDFFIEDGIEGVDSLRNNNMVTRWLKEHQMMGELAQEKVIPECVFRLTREKLALFLNRLFACDGSAYLNSRGSYGISYSSSSKQMAKQVQHLLLRFGIISKIRKKKIRYIRDHRISYELSFHNADSVLKFDEEIGMFGKETNLKKLIEVAASKKGIFMQDTIPKAVWTQVRDIKGHAGVAWTEVGEARSLSRFKDARPKAYKNVRRDTLKIYGDILKSQKLIDLAESDIYWDTIVSIESKGNKQVYDLTVPETHNFVANDFLVHNTSFTLGIAQHIGLTERAPVAIFSLEMSRQQLAQRLMCSEARVDAQSLRTGNLKEEDWPKLSNAVGRLAEAPIFIDDTPNITIMEVRAKARRLMTKHKLGLIVVDYLQLMQGGLRSENRQQEVSEISRSLKILGRELGVPVIAVSQLSRAVEQRTDKRPLLADLRESGCLSGDTLIMRADTGELVTIRKLAEDGEPVPVYSLNGKLKLEVALMTRIFPTGVKKTYDLITRSGRTIRATANHPFRTLQGWARLDQLSQGDRIAVPRALSGPILETSPMDKDRIILLAHLIGDGCYVKRQPLHYTNQDNSCLQAVSTAAYNAFEIQSRLVQQDNWFHVYLPGRDREEKRRNPILKWLDSMGIFNQRSREKIIPAPIFKLSNEQVSLFLRHLWATDGTISRQSSGNNGYVIYYASGSQVLVYQVQHLLLRLGILSTIRIGRKKGYSPTYQLHIQDKDNQLRFLREVGIFGSKSKLVDEALVKLEQLQANPNCDVIPRNVWLEVERARTERGLSFREFHKRLGWSHDGTNRRKHGISRQRLQKILTVLSDQHLNNLAQSDVYWDEVVLIEERGTEEVYDATVPGNHNFVANDLIVHNSIEQDADLVIFIYRDEYYHPETEDKGIAEIIISKHRNGPTGIVKLAFLEHYTKFVNLAKGV